MLNNFRYSLPDTLHDRLENIATEWQTQNKVARVWQRDASVWTGEDEAKWLGWLDVLDAQLADADKYREFYADIEDFERVLLMGMGENFDGALEAAKKVADANVQAWESWMALWGVKK